LTTATTLAAAAEPPATTSARDRIDRSTTPPAAPRLSARATREFLALMIIFVHQNGRKHIEKEKKYVLTKIAVTRTQCRTY